MTIKYQRHNRKLPEIIERVGFDFDWDERKVWKLDIPSEEMPAAKLIWHFDIPFVQIRPGGRYITPRQLIDRPDDYPEEFQRTMQADTSYPIDIMRWRGRWLILDGLHRLMKQTIKGVEVVGVRKIPQSAIPSILRD